MTQAGAAPFDASNESAHAADAAVLQFTPAQEAAPTGRFRSGLLGQLVRFGFVGILSTGLYTGLFVVFRLWCGAQIANTLALLLSALANTAMNRRFTFSIRGRKRRNRHLAQGLVVFGIALGLTGGSLALVHALSDEPRRAVEVIVLTTANVVATCLRFVLLRHWVFRRVP